MKLHFHSQVSTCFNHLGHRVEQKTVKDHVIRLLGLQVHDLWRQILGAQWHHFLRDQLSVATGTHETTEFDGVLSEFGVAIEKSHLRFGFLLGNILEKDSELVPVSRTAHERSKDSYLCLPAHWKNSLRSGASYSGS